MTKGSPKPTGLLPVFRIFARPGENGGLTDIVRMIRVKNAEEYRRRWLETANTVVEIESAPLNEDDNIVYKGRRIFALDELIGGRARLSKEEWIWTTTHKYHARLHSPAPVPEALLARLFSSMDRHESDTGPWPVYKRSFYLPIQSFSPSSVWKKCGVDIPPLDRLPSNMVPFLSGFQKTPGVAPSP